jgi:hypothetical protein
MPRCASRIPFLARPRFWRSGAGEAGLAKRAARRGAYESSSRHPSSVTEGAPRGCASRIRHRLADQDRQERRTDSSTASGCRWASRPVCAAHQRMPGCFRWATRPAVPDNNAIRPATKFWQAYLRGIGHQKGGTHCGAIRPATTFRPSSPASPHSAPPNPRYLLSMFAVLASQPSQQK